MHAAILRVPQLLSAAQQIASGNPAGAVALVREARSLARTAKAAGQRAGISRAEMQAHMEAVAKGNAPTLQDVWLRFASPPIRHAGTLGGNLANGSPIGDGAPVLIALGARLVLQRGEATRSVPLDAFYLDYMKNQLQPGEFISRIDVPLPAPQAGLRDVLRVWKLSKRFDSDISAVCAAFALQLDGGVVRSVRLVYGGLAATVRRAATAEGQLLGQPWCEERVRAAMQALDLDFKPLSDMRASSAYRAKTAANLLWRLWLETRPDAPLTPEQTSVWPVATATSPRNVP